MKICKHCGETLPKNRRKFCSQYCRNKHWKQNNPNYNKEWNENNPERKKELDKNWRKNNPEKVKKSNKKYRQSKKGIQTMEKWKEEHPDYDNNYQNNYQKEKKKTDINFKIKCNLRGRMHHVLKLNQKSKHTEQLLGCTISELKVYLQIFFKPGMNWDNYGKFGWHVDHIIPCCSFDLSKPENQKRCFHFSNLQPLWCVDNWKKNGKK